jgi:hypothetical protein
MEYRGFFPCPPNTSVSMSVPGLLDPGLRLSGRGVEFAAGVGAATCKLAHMYKRIRQSSFRSRSLKTKVGALSLLHEGARAPGFHRQVDAVHPVHAVVFFRGHAPVLLRERHYRVEWLRRMRASRNKKNDFALDGSQCRQCHPTRRCWYSCF